MKTIIFAAPCMLSLVLVGCGGGGGGSGTSVAEPVPIVPPTTAEGVYAGTISNGKSLNALILENDQIYVMYGTMVNGNLMVSGFIEGNGKSNNGSFSASDMRDFSPNGTSPNFSLSASYVKNTSFNGTTTDGSTTISFTGGPLQNSLYNYNTAANIANIVGAWTVTDLAGTPVALNISASGSFTGSTSGCAFTGTIKPRASGKNVFDAVATFGAAPCLLPGQTVSGIALEYPLAGGGRQLIIAGTDALRNNGAAYLGAR